MIYCIRVRQIIIVRIFIFSQKMRRYFFAILSRKNIFRRKDILKYLLGNYHFKSDNIFLKYIIANRGENIFFEISSRKLKRYFAARYMPTKISFHFCEKIFQKYIIFSMIWKNIFWYRYEIFGNSRTGTSRTRTGTGANTLGSQDKAVIFSQIWDSFENPCALTSYYHVPSLKIHWLP